MVKTAEHRRVGDDLRVSLFDSADVLLRTVVLRIGGTYRVEPLELSKKRHRGRLCIVESISRDDLFATTKRTIDVRFLDSRRLARVDPSDLVATTSD
jgi:hypothetical protein